MSFSSHRRKVLDGEESLEHRASHARSCALHVANKLGISREAVIDRVLCLSGVSLHLPKDAERLLTAFSLLEKIRNEAGGKQLNFPGGWLSQAELQHPNGA